jgi:transglutaminase-like putative cysteine protease
MSRIFTSRAKPSPDASAYVDDQEELSDVPLTPREGWTSVIALSVMMLAIGLAIDDAGWAARIGTTSSSATGFLPICGVLSVLVGVALSKSRFTRYTGHLIGSLIGAAFLLNAVAASVSVAPAIETRLHDLNISVSTWIEEVVVIGTRSNETSIFLLVLGALVWGAGQFSAYAVFRRHRPLPAVALTGFIMLVNVSITVRDQYVHLIVFMAAALVLLIRLNLLDQAREWRARGMRDVADVSHAFMRNGAVFVAIAIVAATTLAANASSAPLGRAWRDMDDDLLEVGYAINRFLGGVSGSARGPNILFTPNQTIRGVWESSSVVVFEATSTDDTGHRWRGATYDSFDGNTWQQTDRSPQIVEAGGDILAGTVEPVRENDGRHIAVVTVTPKDYADDTIVAPDAPAAVNQQVEVQTNGPAGSFISAKLVNGVQPDVPYVVQSFVRDDSGEDELTGNQLAAAGVAYPDWINRYLAIRPGSIGELVTQTARQIKASLPEDRQDPYHLTVAVQDWLYRTGGFEYVTDVRGQCEDNLQLVDCFIQNKQGYCEFFATAMVMLMRELGVPARYVLGYLPGKDPENDGTYTVDRGAAHAWVEVWFPTYGWVEFDPTPGNDENGQSPTVLRAGPDVGPAPTIGAPQGEDPNPPECADPLDPACFGEDGPELPGTVTPPPPTDGGIGPIVLIGAIIAALGGLALFAASRRMPSTEPERAYRGVTSLATRLGYGPRPSQTAYEFAAGLGELVPVAQEDLNLIATAKVEATYGRRTAGDGLLRRLGVAYRRVRFGLLRLVIRRPKIGLRPRSRKPRSS